ncbi:MAG: polyprenol phosphomannose-dependent alpha 1,6 mannosyltransferase MptB [Actinobacteria bacterium]|nr:polyprenol phosphomannose-dependent alpha 1,6 mannosyltransferase MptB [Actinomycetota bacterium]
MPDAASETRAEQEIPNMPGESRAGGDAPAPGDYGGYGNGNKYMLPAAHLFTNVQGIVDSMWGYLDRWDRIVRSRWPFHNMVAEPSAAEVALESPFQLLIRPALLGFLAVCAISVGSSLPASPYALKLPGAWFFGVPASGSILPQGAPVPGLYPHAAGSPLLSLVLVYGGLVVFMRVWYGLVRTLARRPKLPVAYLVVVFALWALPLLVAPPIFSRDIYSYVAQGDMVTHHISPYRYGPFVLGGDHYASLVDPLWGNVPAPYGPFFLILDGGATMLAMHNLILNVVLLRLLALAGVVLMAAFIPYLARTAKRDPAEIFALAILNPVTIFHLIGGSHNDAIMLGLLVAGVALAKKGYPIAGIVICTMAAAIKVPAALGVVYIGFEWARSKRLASTPMEVAGEVAAAGMPEAAGPAMVGMGSPGGSMIVGYRRPGWLAAAWNRLGVDMKRLVLAALLSFGVMEALTLVSGFGWSWVTSLLTPGTVRSWLAPATATGMMLAGLMHVVGISVSAHSILSMTRAAGLLLALFLGIKWLFNYDRLGLLKAMGLTFLAVVVLGPVVQPWYLSWGVIFLVIVAEGRLRSIIIGVSMASAFIGLPGAHHLLDGIFRMDPLALAVTLLLLLAALTVPLMPTRTPMVGSGKRIAPERSASGSEAGSWRAPI